MPQIITVSFLCRMLKKNAERKGWHGSNGPEIAECKSGAEPRLWCLLPEKPKGRIGTL
jgi:hypothetical protein